MKPSFIHDLSVPAVAAPMFLISGPKLVIECCKNGVVGTFPALNHRSTDGFEAWVIEIKEALATFEKETGNSTFDLYFRSGASVYTHLFNTDTFSMGKTLFICTIPTRTPATRNNINCLYTSIYDF